MCTCGCAERTFSVMLSNAIATVVFIIAVVSRHYSDE